MANPFSTDYKSPLPTTKYFKMSEEGAYLIRILTPKTEVETYFAEFVDTAEGKKKVTYPDNGDGVIPKGQSPEGPKLRWALTVYNHDIDDVQVWEISQSSIRDFLFAIAKGKVKSDWTKFDIQITKKGQKMETTYTLIADDTSPLSPEKAKKAEETFVNLKAMVVGQDPFEMAFETSEAGQLPNVDEAVSNVQMPF